MKKLLALLIITIVSFGLVACKSDDTLTIGFAASTFTNPFFLDIEDGIKSALEGTDIELVSLGADNDAAKQAGQIEDLIAQGVDVILLNPVDSTTVGTQILAANEAGIPVITVDRGADDGVVIAHVASDNVAGGEMAATYLNTICAEGTPVLELLGQPGASAATDRSAGFNDIFGAANVDYSVTANWSRAEAQTVTEAFIASQGNPTAICVFAANDEMALGVVNAIKGTSGMDIALSSVVGFDAIADAIVSVEAGDLMATVEQQPFEIGRLAAEAAIDYLNGDTVTAVIPVELALITKED